MTDVSVAVTPYAAGRFLHLLGNASMENVAGVARAVLSNSGVSDESAHGTCGGFWVRLGTPPEPDILFHCTRAGDRSIVVEDVTECP